jgi:hypothetical protein
MNIIFRRGNIQRGDHLGKGCPFILKVIFYQYIRCALLLVIHADATELHEDWYVDNSISA